MCAAIAVRGTELFTSSSFSYTRLALATHFILYPFFPCPPNFLSILLFSLFVSVLFMHYLHFFFFTFSAHSVFCCCLFFFLPCSSSSHSSSISQPPHPPPPFLLSVSPLLSSLYLSPALSALRRVSAITPLHLLIPVLIQPSTHSCLTSLYTALTNIRTHTHVHAPCRLHTCPPRTQGAQCVHTLTPAYCAEKCPL